MVSDIQLISWLNMVAQDVDHRMSFGRQTDMSFGGKSQKSWSAIRSYPFIELWQRGLWQVMRCPFFASWPYLYFAARSLFANFPVLRCPRGVRRAQGQPHRRSWLCREHSSNT